MKKRLAPLAAGALLLATSPLVHGQYAPPPPTQPFAGFLNDYLRQKDPYYSNWDIGGSLRLRYEIKENGLGLPAANDFRNFGFDNDNSYFSDKILARVAYSSKWWGVYVEGRSSSTTGDDRNSVAAYGGAGGSGPESDGPVDLHQAYFTLGNHKEFPVSLKVGRQELSYGDERLVGAFAWNNIGRVFDAAKLRWQSPWFAAEAFTSRIVLPNDNNFNMWNDYNLFSGVHVTTREIPKTIAEFYGFARNDSKGNVRATLGAFPPFQAAAPFARDIYTLGGRIRSATNELGNFDYTIEGAYQFGDWKATAASARMDHNAYAFMANVGYTFADTPGKPRVALEYSFGSGDSDPTDDQHETFDNLYPTNHKFYGYMDFFSWQNLHDMRSIVTIRPTPRLSLALEGHLFWLADTADNLYNVGGAPRGAGATAGTGFGRNPTYSSFVGGELDFVAGFAINKFASLEAGYGHFFVGDYIKQTWSAPGFGSTDADWFYIQTVIRF
jgi:hypothetical protein